MAENDYDGMSEKQRRQMWREVNSYDRSAKRAVRARLLRGLKKRRREAWREKQKTPNNGESA